MIRKCAQYKKWDNILNIYHEIQDLSKLPPDIHALSIKACVELNDLMTGSKIENIIKTNKLQSLHNISFKNNLIELYGKCSSIDDGRRMFDAIPRKYKIIDTYLSMLKVFISHHQYLQGSKFYTHYKHEIDSILKLKTDDTDISRVHELNCYLIEIYGK